MLVQTGIAAPLVLALVVYTAQQGGRSSVHRTLFWLLTLMLSWMIGMVIADRDAVPRALTIALLIPPACFMSPLFLLLMLQYSRVELFERHEGTRWVLLAPFWIFLVAFLTQDWHGLMVDPSSSMTHSGAANDAGPLFWAFQVWSNCVATAGLAICVHTGWTTHSPSERRRMSLLCLGASVPLIAHLAFMFELLPTEYPLTPSALALTALMIVAAIQRYKLLDVQPIARRDVVEASSDGVIVADVDEIVVDLNPAAAALLGAERSELYGTPLSELLERLGPSDPDRTLTELLQAVRAGHTPPRIELETASGSVVEVSAGTPNDASGARAGYFVVLRDRSSERRAERMLHQRQKLESVGILAAGIAHEVNNPLAFVRANFAHLKHLAALVEDEMDALPEKVAEELRDLPDVIEESADGLDRIRGIVQDLLRFSRMPSGRRVECDVNEALLEAVRFASLDRGSSVRVETRVSEDLPAVRASREQLVQVLLNLLLNARHALKHSDEAWISATTCVAGRWVEVRVKDNGPGVPEAIRNKIFDPFFTTGAADEGTGLGLAIAFDIVRDHGGALELECPPEGGACFVLRLPANTAF